MVFPEYIVTPKEAHKIVVALQNKLCQKFGYSMDDIKNVIDLSVYKTGLRMIGSYKKNDLRCYLPLGVKRNSLTKQHVSESLLRHSYDLPVSNNSKKIFTKYEPVIQEIQRLNSEFKAHQ